MGSGRCSGATKLRGRVGEGQVPGPTVTAHLVHSAAPVARTITVARALHVLLQPARARSNRPRSVSRNAWCGCRSTLAGPPDAPSPLWRRPSVPGGAVLRPTWRRRLLCRDTDHTRTLCTDWICRPSRPTGWRGHRITTTRPSLRSRVPASGKERSLLSPWLLVITCMCGSAEARDRGNAIGRP